MSSAYERGIDRAHELLRGARDLGEAALAERSVELAGVLLEASHAGAEPSERERAARVASLLCDPIGQAFVSALTDRAHRSSSGARLVAEVETLVRHLGAPRSLAAWDRLQLRALQAFGSALPELTARAVRRRIYEDAAPYLAPAEPRALDAFLAERKLLGLRVNVNHLGEEVLGADDAARFFANYLALLARPEVSTISVKLSSIDARIEPTAWQPTLERLSGKLTEIYRAALANAVPGAGGLEPKLVYLDMEAYRDLELTVELFTRVLDRPEFEQLTAGIVLQAYVPDSHGHQERLLEWARERVRRGGAPVRLRLVKGANLMLERIEASLRGWQLPLYGSKAEVDASFRHMLQLGAQPEHARAMRLGVGSHNLFDIAFTLLLRKNRGVEAEVEPEMLEGMADPLRRVVQRVGGKVLVYAPSVDERDFASAVVYLVRRLDENTAEDNFLRRSFAMQVGDQNFALERGRFLAALARADAVDPTPRRRQDRTQPPPEPPRDGFLNEPDTDFTLAVNRRWLDAALAAARTANHAPVCSRFGGTTYDGENTREGFDPSRPGVVPYQWRPIAAELLEEVLEKAQLARARAAAWPAEEREAALFAVARAPPRGACSIRRFAGARRRQARARGGRRGVRGDRLCRVLCAPARAAARALHARSQGRGGGHTALEFPALDRARLGLGCARRGQRGPAEAAAGDPARRRARGGAVSRRGRAGVGARSGRGRGRSGRAADRRSPRERRDAHRCHGDRAAVSPLAPGARAAGRDRRKERADRERDERIANKRCSTRCAPLSAMPGRSAARSACSCSSGKYFAAHLFARSSPTRRARCRWARPGTRKVWSRP